MKYGFVKVASAIPGVRPGNCKYNTESIINLMLQAEEENADIVCFPELSITGYTCQDLFESSVLIKEAEKSLDVICKATRNLNTIEIVGLPLVIGNFLANCAVVLHRGEIIGVVPKTYLPNYKEFYEQRWFASASNIKEQEIKILGKEVPVSSGLIFKTAEIIFNLSADNEGVGKNSYLKSMLREQSARTLSGYVFSSCGFGESTQDVVFAGNAIICENGRIIASSERFCMREQLITSEINTTFCNCAAIEIGNENFKTIYIDKTPNDKTNFTLTRRISPHPFVPVDDLDERCNEIINIQTEGLAKRILHTKAKTVVIGVSGGLDSTLALLICAKTFDALGISHKNIIGVTMPGFGTSKGTHSNALSLMTELGVTIREIPIKQACLQHFSDIGHNPDIHDTTYENSQARERTQVLMDVANQTNGLVIGTGDLSELALGWATYNGDHMSMYGVNSSIPKTLIRHLIKWIAGNTSNAIERGTLIDIINTPISPELIPTDENGQITQKTEDKIGPYELHDFFIYYAIRYGFGPEKIYFLARNAFNGNCKHCEKSNTQDIKAPYYDNETIKYWLKTFFQRFFSQQFKRSCLPDGPKVGSCSLSPRGDWRMPSDADAYIWLSECDKL